jgi:predicted RNase H-like nuclease
MCGATWVAGLDGCRNGWIAVIITASHANARVRFVKNLMEIVAAPEAPAIIAIDIPIGLPERSGPRGRTPDRLVRALLGVRQSSVFSIPSRAAVYASIDAGVPQPDRFKHACAVARQTSAEAKGVAWQGFNIFDKIITVDCALREQTSLVGRVFECHPEVSFWAMNGKVPLAEAKKVRNKPHLPGLELRRRLLLGQGFPVPEFDLGALRGCRAGRDDLIDACAAAWTAARLARGSAIAFPDPPERDAFGLPMAIWV